MQASTPIAAGGGKWEMRASPTAFRCPAFVGVNPRYAAASLPQAAVGLGASATVLAARPMGMKRGSSEAKRLNADTHATDNPRVTPLKTQCCQGRWAGVAQDGVFSARSSGEGRLTALALAGRARQRYASGLSGSGHPKAPRDSIFLGPGGGGWLGLLAGRFPWVTTRPNDSGPKARTGAE